MTTSKKNEWWKKIPQKSQLSELRYYQTELKVVTIQLTALTALELVDCYNFCVFQNKLPLSNILSNVEKSEMISTLTSTKEYLERCKFWFNKVRLQST